MESVISLDATAAAGGDAQDDPDLEPLPGREILHRQRLDLGRGDRGDAGAQPEQAVDPRRIRLGAGDDAGPGAILAQRPRGALDDRIAGAFEEIGADRMSRSRATAASIAPRTSSILSGATTAEALRTP